MFRHLIFLIVISCLLGSCLPSPYFQSEESIPGNSWQYQFKPSFKFEINDTNSYYHLFFLVRHTDAYPFENIWLWVYTKEPGDTSFSKTRIEIPLAERNGKWLGRGMGEIYEQRMPISGNGNYVFKKRGLYEIRFEQNMRVDPLPEVLHVGLRIEKAGRRN